MKFKVGNQKSTKKISLFITLVEIFNIHFIFKSLLQIYEQLLTVVIGEAVANLSVGLRIG